MSGVLVVETLLVLVLDEVVDCVADVFASWVFDVDCEALLVFDAVVVFDEDGDLEPVADTVVLTLLLTEFVFIRDALVDCDTFLLFVIVCEFVLVVDSLFVPVVHIVCDGLGLSDGDIVWVLVIGGLLEGVVDSVVVREIRGEAVLDLKLVLDFDCVVDFVEVPEEVEDFDTFIEGDVVLVVVDVALNFFVTELEADLIIDDVFRNETVLVLVTLTEPEALTVKLDVFVDNDDALIEGLAVDDFDIRDETDTVGLEVVLFDGFTVTVPDELLDEEREPTDDFEGVPVVVDDLEILGEYVADELELDVDDCVTVDVSVNVTTGVFVLRTEDVVVFELVAVFVVIELGDSVNVILGVHVENAELVELNVNFDEWDANLEIIADCDFTAVLVLLADGKIGSCLGLFGWYSELANFPINSTPTMIRNIAKALIAFYFKKNRNSSLRYITE